MNCIFCQIQNKTIPSQILLENDHFFVIPDINPKSPTHLLIISQQHFQDFNAVQFKSSQAYQDFFELIQEISQKFKIPNYNLQINNGKAAGQEVFHFHAHFLSSHKLSL